MTSVDSPSECAHEWSWKATWPKPGDCDRLNYLQCLRCAKWVHTRCQSARSSVCRPCAARHRQRVAAIGRSGATDLPSGFFFVTITAPGVDQLPWAEGEAPAELDDGDHVATDRRTVEPRAANAWNATAGQRWSWLMTCLRREVGPVEFFKCWEFQKRGVLHLHALLRVEHPITRRRLRSVLQSGAVQWGFGRQIDVQHIEGTDAATVARKSGYCAKYASKSADQKLAFVVVDDDGELLRRGSVRPWSASRGWGDTMAAVKARQRLWVVLGASGPTAAQRQAAAAQAERSGAGAERPEGPLDLKTVSYTPE